MNLRNVIALNALVALGVGMAFVLYPGFLMASYGVTQIPEGWALTRLFGVTLVSFGLVMWCIKDVAMSSARRIVTVALLSTNIFGLLIVLLQQQAIWSVRNALVGWLTVGVYVVFVSAYGYLLTKTPKSLPI
jgi:hypothetical protein